MTFTRTNRKDVTFCLCRHVTKTGKPRYFFAREPDKGEPVEAIPEGYEVVESVTRGSSHVPTAAPPMTIEGMPASLSRCCSALTERKSCSISCLPFCQSSESRLKLGQGCPTFLGEQGFCRLQLRFERGL